jgi:hypothetical protein
MMQVSKRVPFEDPQVLLGVRILYVVSNLIIFGLYYYIGMKIKSKRGMLIAQRRTWTRLTTVQT